MLKIVSLVFFVIVIFLLSFYWFYPFNTIEFYTQPSRDNGNFTLGSSVSGNMMQFYENMRYPNKEISYRIENCPNYKTNDIKEALEIISNLTVLEFYPVENNENIYATCQDRNIVREGLFIAGEGGPIDIVQTESFNVILKGEMLLIRETNCKTPNVATHELFHTLGFDHSENPDNIMYSVSKCSQEIGNDLINKINELYSVESLSDLKIENVSAMMNGKYLDMNLSVRNHGLKESGRSKILVYADDKIVHEIEVDQMDIGYGFTISLENIFIFKLNVKEITAEIVGDFPELDKSNNKIKLEIKVS